MEISDPGPGGAELEHDGKINTFNSPNTWPPKGVTFREQIGSKGWADAEEHLRTPGREGGL